MTWPLLFGVAEPTSATPPIAAVGRLGIDRKWFTVEGFLFSILETSEFSLFKRYLDGEDVQAIRRQRAAIGFNGERVWLLNRSVVGARNEGAQDEGIHPDQYPGDTFYARLRDYVLAGPQFVDITVFTSTGSLMPDEKRQQRHLDATAEAVRGLPNAVLSLVNEYDQWDNATATLVRPAGVIITRGSGGADSRPPAHEAPWDAEEYHTNDLDEWWRKVGHNAMELADESGKPCWSSENTRPDRDGTIRHHEDAGENGALLCAGSCFHSEQGKYSRLFTGLDLACAEAWVRGARKVPLEFQRGAYSRHNELNGPQAIRVHRRTLPPPDGRSYTQSVRP